MGKEFTGGMVKLGVLRGFGYFIGIVIIIGSLFLPFIIGIPIIIGAIIMMWFLKKGGQVSNMQKELKSIRKLEEERMRDDLTRRSRDAMGQGWE